MEKHSQIGELEPSQGTSNLCLSDFRIAMDQ